MAISDFRIERREPIHLALVRRNVRPELIPATIGECFGLVFAYLEEHGLEPASAPLAVYHSMTQDEASYSAGVAVTSPITGQGEVQPWNLPAGECAACTLTGPYDGLPGAHAALAAWVASQGRSLAGEPSEEYITDPAPGSDPATWRTVIRYPLAPGDDAD